MSRLSGLDPGPIAPIASLLTLGAGVWATVEQYVRAVPGAWIRLGLALTLGAGSEVLGLATGLPFGRYTYTGEWWPTVRLPCGPFPLALPFAWLLMAGAANLSIASSSKFARPIWGGLLAAVVDLLMEPVMAGRLGYWRWLVPGPLPGNAPWANFFGWWAVAAAAGLVLTAGTPSTATRRPRWVLGGFLVLVAGLGFVR